MFGHPKGLRTLFFTEMWERFSYYGMRGLLILFMPAAIERGGFGMSEGDAGAIYGLYTAFVYLTALPGGWIADRIIGARQAVFIGGCIIAAGHFSMAIPGKFTFFAGLVLIVIGTGLLKPNVSAIVGDLYPEGGARKDAGFSIFYMGINLGAFLGPLICGYLGEEISWHFGFSAAGIGMVFGLIQYKFGLSAMGTAGEAQVTDPQQLAVAKSQLFKGLAGIVALGLLLWGLHASAIYTLSLSGFAQAIGGIIVVLAVLYFAYVLLFGGYSPEENKRILVIFFLFIGAAIFWSGFEQAGSSLNLFAERLTDRNILGWLMPASWLQSVNALFIILLAPVFGWLWVWLGSREPSIPMKFGLGLVLLGVGFLVLAWAAVYATVENPVVPAWLVVTYFFHTAGELCLSPVGLSSVTKLSPKPLVGQMMGVWFMGTALGNLIAGLLGGTFETLPVDELFRNVAYISVIAGIFFILVKSPIKKMIGVVK